MMTRKRRKLWAMFMAAALVVTQLPAVAMAEDNVPEDKVNFAAGEREDGPGHGSIAFFEELPSGVAEQTVDVGTELSALNLPDTVTVTIYHVTEDALIEDEDAVEDDSVDSSTASSSNADESASGTGGGDSSEKGGGGKVTTVTTTEEEIFVTWDDGEPAYDGDIEGRYVFTADVNGYVLSGSAELPRITVDVAAEAVGNGMKPPANGPLEKTVTDWAFVDDENLNEGVLALINVSLDHQADFDTVVSMLPTQISGTVDKMNGGGADKEGALGQGGAASVTLDITWRCPEYKKDDEGNWPLTGEYTFTAELPEGYTCDSLPTVRVLMGGAVLFSINDRFSVDGLRYKELGPDTVQLVGYDGEKPTGELTIPSSVTKPSNNKAYAVVSVGAYAFLGCKGLTGDLILPDTIAEIGNFAFRNCSGFTGSLTLSDTLTRIGDFAFEGCSGFAGDLILPDTLTYIGNFAFYGCSGFTGGLTLSDTLIQIGDYAFADCSGFTGGLTLPDTLTHIGAYAFYRCSGFTGGLALPDTLIQIGDYAFADCSGFTGGLTLSDALTHIGKFAFYRCSGFTGDLILPDTLTRLEDYTFWGCSGFTGGLTLSTTLTHLGDAVFSGCSGFTGNLILPDTLTHIGESVFNNCSGLTVYNASSQMVADLLHDSGVAMGQIQVQGGIYTPSSSKVFIQNGMVYEITGANTVTLTRASQIAMGSLTIPETIMENTVSYTVTAIGRSAFSNCSGFTGELTLPNTLTQIGDFAFNNCSGFTGELTLPNTLTQIGDYAFYGCSGFTGKLTLPNTLIQIGDYAFEGCSGFTGELTLPDTLIRIGDSAFNNCSGFTGELTLPDTLIQIGDYAFYNCSGFTGELILPNMLAQVGAVAFANCSGFTGELTLPDTLTHIGESAFANCSGFTGRLTLPDALIHIGGSAFEDCSGLTSAHLGKNLQELGIYAFPSSLPLFTDSPRVQLLINEYLDHDTIADTAWDGTEDVPDGAIATVKQNAVVNGDKRIGREAEITVADGVTLTVNGTLTVYGVLTISGTISGSGKLIIRRGAIVTGNLSGIRVEYPSDGGGSDGGSSYTNPNILHGTWTRTDVGVWMFRLTSGSYATSRWGLIDGQWYYFDHEGKMLTGWQLLNNRWYYMCTEETAKQEAGRKEGAMLTGWYFDPAYQSWFYLDASGAMVTGWKEISGKWYYFYGNGAMAVNAEVDGYKLGSDGAWIK